MARRHPTAAPVGGATAIADTKAAKPPPVAAAAAVAAAGDDAAPTPPSSKLALRMPLSTLADQQGSQLFTGYRALGHVCDGVPVALQFHNTHSYVLTSVGHSFHLYGCSKLNLLFVSQATDRRIRALAIYKRYHLTATGNVINVFRRAKLVRTLESHTASIKTLLVFGSQLLSVSNDNVLKVWELTSFTEVHSIAFPDDFTISAIVHPHTYLNKILLASEQGTMQLWNIRTAKLVHRFKGWGCPITCIDQAPALDIVGVGLADGRSVVHNIKFDETLVSFSHAQGGAVSSIAFRSDQTPTLATGSTSGQISVWDLEKKKLVTIIKDAHNAPVSSLRFLPREPVMVTASDDNTLKMWIFDQPDGTARLLRSRSGHSGAPDRVRFYKDARAMLSSSREDQSLRATFTFRDQMNRELSQRNLEHRAKKFHVDEQSLRLAPIVDFDACPVREREWDNIVTCHLGQPSVRTWNFEKGALGTHKLHPPPAEAPVINKSKLEPASIHRLSIWKGQPSSTPPAALVKPKDTSHNVDSGMNDAAIGVAISACGNYCFVARDNGNIDKYNLQSGAHRGSCFSSTLPSQRHSQRITAIATDSLNTNVITSSLDGTIRLWDFNTLALCHSMSFGSAVTKLAFNRESGLLAATGDDCVIRLFDVHTRRLVRRYSGHSNQITDMTFSNDGRWLVSSSLDCTVRTWDLVSGQLIDWFRVPSAVTSLAFSPSGEFLATTHLSDLGIYLWANKNHFSSVLLKPPPTVPVAIALPKADKVTKETDDARNRGDDGGGDDQRLAADDDDADSDEEILADESDDEHADDAAAAVEDESDDEDGANAKRKRSGGDGGDDEDDGDEPSAKRRRSSGQLGELITLSGMPRARIKTLVNLEQIKERNKPTKAIRLVGPAPFLLPTLTGLDPKFVSAADKQLNDKQQARSRILNLAHYQPTTPFMHAIFEADPTRNNTAPLQLLASMSPAAIDFEIQSLATEQEIALVLRFLTRAFKTHDYFELLQAFLNVVLNVHGDTITGSDVLLAQAQKLAVAQKESWKRLEGLFHNNLCLIGFFSGLQT